MFNFLKTVKRFIIFKKENLPPSLLGEQEVMKSAEMISVREFSFRTERSSVQFVSLIPRPQRGPTAVVRSALQGLALLPILGR